jgi:hypothetical protein
MIKKEILVVVTLALTALAGYYGYNTTVSQVENVSNLDMTCGFTADFEKFIAASMKSLI